MTDHSTPWPVGAPAWVDISVTDIERSKAFYSTVLGWDYEGGGEDFGGYLNATVDGRKVAGMAPPMEGMPEPPHVWTAYVAVEDSAATEQAVTEAGGTTIMPPMEVGPFGTMALYADPTGAGFGTWQSGTHQGFERTGEHGSPSWIEAMVGDYERGKEFYTQVFGWHYQDISADGMKYAMFGVPGEEPPMSGGIGEVEAGQQPSWTLNIEVDDVDAIAQRVTDAGGRVTTEPFDFEFGRLALVTGPDGEPFGLVTSSPTA
jgi:hypothetical protein